MIYLFYGINNYSIKKQIEKIKSNFETINISYYDLNNDKITDVLDDSNTISLFAEKKLIICENASVFTRGNSKGAKEIEDYLKNINQNTTLIFIVNNDSIDKNKKITKLILKNGHVIEAGENPNIIDFVKDSFKNYNITNTTINLLLNRVGNNPLILENEINKIKLYKNDDLNICDADIINITHKNIDVDIFKLIDYIVKDDKNKALEIYYEMLKINEEPIKIIIMLANQFRIMYQAKELLKRGLTEKEIAATLKIHPYRVKLALQNSRNYDSKTLLKFISYLADMDINIKTGKINKDLALDLFILKKGE